MLFQEKRKKEENMIYKEKKCRIQVRIPPQHQEQSTETRENLNPRSTCFIK